MDRPHPGRLTLGPDEAHGLPRLHARIAQYPDCQQLQLWLPPEHFAGWTRLRVFDGTGRCVVDRPVDDLLQARRQVLLDTLPWPPGALQLTIGHVDGGALTLQLHKAGDDEPPVLPQPASSADDGEDLGLRERSREQLVQRLLRRVDCVAHERGLRAVYTEPGLTLSFDVEIGVDGRPMRLHAPAAADWEACTGVRAGRRREILSFVADRLGLDAAGRGDLDHGDHERGRGDAFDH